MTHKAIMTLILTAALFVPATGFAKVHTSYDQDAAPAAYKTYSWNTGESWEGHDTAQQIQAGIDAELAAQGFDRVEEGGDLEVSLELSAAEETRTHVTEIHPRYPYRGRHWHRWSLGYDLVRVDSYNVNAGTLRVELTDSATDEAVWTGEADGLVRKSPEKNARKAIKTVGKMFRDFPFEPAIAD